MKLLLIVLISVASFNAQAKLSSMCTRALEEIQANDITAKFIAYLSTLHEMNILTTIDLELMNENLIKQSFIANPLNAVNHASSDHLTHASVIQDYIQSGEINTYKLGLWLRDFLKQQSNTKQEKDKSKNDTEKPAIEMQFVPIQPDLQNEEYKYIIKRPFTVMTTAVTRKMWHDLMKVTPEDKEANGYDYPIRNITWYSALVYANELSKKHNLRPVYDLSEVQTEGNAAEGTLVITGGKIKINAPDKDIYRAEGYRLPTQLEMEFLLTDRGRCCRENEYFTNITDNNINNYAWHSENSNDHLHTVAELQAFMIDVQPIYDLYGNISIWTFRHIDVEVYNAVKHSTSSCYRSQLSDFKNRHDGSVVSHNAIAGLGIRLVRSLLK